MSVIERFHCIRDLVLQSVNARSAKLVTMHEVQKNQYLCNYTVDSSKLHSEF